MLRKYRDVYEVCVAVHLFVCSSVQEVDANEAGRTVVVNCFVRRNSKCLS